MKHCCQIRDKGIVQGVGFRPFIYRIAALFHIMGRVWNDTQGVLIHAEGGEDDIHHFIQEISANPPPLAVIQDIEQVEIPCAGYGDFTIVPSRVLETRSTFIPPDICICDECLEELFDPEDKRFQYPFITCTNCGPRFSIVDDIPYDRSRTSMEQFSLCPYCRGEYEDPQNRRFHTQPVACPACGPHLTLHKNTGEVVSVEIRDIVTRTVQLIREGNIIAIKGTGGYLLGADARQDSAVLKLRERKCRPFKAFALMAGTVERIKDFCHVTEHEKSLLLSKERPIVLLLEKEPLVSRHIAPSGIYQGVMLPYMPFHYQLFHEDSSMVLIMTSGNVSDEPIVFRDRDAFTKLSHIADYFVTYNRDIISQTDDSVVFADGDETHFIRRSRGYVPAPFYTGKGTCHILAAGGDLKNTFALAKDDTIILSQYLGDLATPGGNRQYRDTVDRFQKIYDFSPEIIVSDLHPGYFTTAIADEFEEKGLRRIRVQHHHAHIASVIEDRSIEGPVIGIAYDGTGYGTDGTLWGSEIMVADTMEFRRMGHFSYFPLPGGESAITDVWKIGISLLHQCYGRDVPLLDEENGKDVVFEIIEKKINSPMTCSIGRIFDGIAAILGLSRTISTEAEAAQRLEMAAMNGINPFAVPYEIPFIQEDGFVIRTDALTRYIVELLQEGRDVESIAYLFHLAIAKTTENVIAFIAREKNINNIVLSGGVFQNRLLLSMVREFLEKNGLQVYLPRRIPVNDGCIAMGQIAVAKEMVDNGKV